MLIHVAHAMHKVLLFVSERHRGQSHPFRFSLENLFGDGLVNQVHFLVLHGLALVNETFIETEMPVEKSPNGGKVGGGFQQIFQFQQLAGDVSFRHSRKLKGEKEEV